MELSIKQGRLAGSEFKINITSLLLLILIFFSALYPTGMHSTLLATLVICAAFAYVPVHEVGHSPGERKAMNRQEGLKLLNPILAMVFLNQVATGLLRDSLSPETFEVLHEGGALVLSVVIIGHLLLNGNWIKAQYFRKSKIQL